MAAQNNVVAVENNNSRDVFGVKRTSRGYAIGDVLLDAAAKNEVLTTRQVQERTHASKLGQEYEKANGKRVAAVNGHLTHLFDCGFLNRTGHGYILNLDETSAMLAPVIAEVKKRKGETAKPKAEKPKAKK
ncbi:MAG: hypothetical protein ACRC1D_06820 [Culicoidibacterales bacterium]